MKGIMNKNLMLSLIFVLLFFGMLWAMPNLKIESIGDFFEKIITPIAVIIATKSGFKKFIELIGKKDKLD